MTTPLLKKHELRILCAVIQDPGHGHRHYDGMLFGSRVGWAKYGGATMRSLQCVAAKGLIRLENGQSWVPTELGEGIAGVIEKSRAKA